MKLNIVKWGNSTAVRLPAPLLAQLDAHLGDALDAEVVKGKLILRVAKPQGLSNDAALEAVKFALNPRTTEGMAFLRHWMHGEFDAIRKGWPGAPKTLFIGEFQLSQHQKDNGPPGRPALSQVVLDAAARLSRNAR